MSENRTASVQELGLDPAKVAELLRRVQEEVDNGLLPAVQVALARHGKVGVFECFGDARPDSLIPIFSATKGITSAAAWLLIQEGKLSEDERVADIIPEFASNGKEVVTVQQLFTHTAGFPNAPFRPLQWRSRQERAARYQQWRLSWEPGSRFEYHPSSSMWIIAELIERRSGQDARDKRPPKPRMLRPTAHRRIVCRGGTFCFAVVRSWRWRRAPHAPLTLRRRSRHALT